MDSNFPNIDNKKAHNIFCLTPIYDLLSHTYADTWIDGQQTANEQRALTFMVNCCSISSAIILADQGNEFYNCFAHMQEKG